MDKAKQLSLKAAWKLDEGSVQGGRGQAAARQTCALLLMHLPVPCLVGSFRKIRGILFWGRDNKAPTILRVPYFRNCQLKVEERVLPCVQQRQVQSAADLCQADSAIPSKPIARRRKTYVLLRIVPACFLRSG